MIEIFKENNREKHESGFLLEKNLRGGGKRQYTAVFKTISYCFYCFLKILGVKSRFVGPCTSVSESQKLRGKYYLATQRYNTVTSGESSLRVL